MLAASSRDHRHKLYGPQNMSPAPPPPPPTAVICDAVKLLIDRECSVEAVDEVRGSDLSCSALICGMCVKV